MVKLKKNSISISIVTSLLVLISLVILAFDFNIKPGASSFIETDEYLHVSKGVINAQNFQIPIGNSMQEALITTTIKNIDISWIVCILMISYLIFIVFLARGKVINMKKHLIQIVIVTLFIIANLIRISMHISYLTDILT